MGEVRCRGGAVGPQTRGCRELPDLRLRVDPELIRALAPSAVAARGLELGSRPAWPTHRAGGRRVPQDARRPFPIDVFHRSSTSTNMNVNEVVARLATARLGRDVHPNDHVNASQSSNDTFPSAMHVAATTMLVHDLVPALGHLAASLRAKQEEFAEVVTSGRTHLMDATPVRLGRSSGIRHQVEHGSEGAGLLGGWGAGDRRHRSAPASMPEGTRGRRHRAGDASDSRSPRAPTTSRSGRTDALARRGRCRVGP